MEFDSLNSLTNLVESTSENIIFCKGKTTDVSPMQVSNFVRSFDKRYPNKSIVILLEEYPGKIFGYASSDREDLSAKEWLKRLGEQYNGSGGGTRNCSAAVFYTETNIDDILTTAVNIIPSIS